MTKLCSRLLVSLVLAAVVAVTCGFGFAPAHRSPWSSRSGDTPTAFQRPGVGTFSGEPDGTGQGAPQPVVKPSSMFPTSPNYWLAQLWIRWRFRGQFEPHRPNPR